MGEEEEEDHGGQRQVGGGRGGLDGRDGCGSAAAVLPILLLRLPTSAGHRSRLLTSAQLTTFHQAAR